MLFCHNNFSGLFWYFLQTLRPSQYAPRLYENVLRLEDSINAALRLASLAGCNKAALHLAGCIKAAI